MDITIEFKLKGVVIYEGQALFTKELRFPLSSKILFSSHYKILTISKINFNK